MSDVSQRIADEYCREVAIRLRRNPDLVLRKARSNLRRMRPHCHESLIGAWERALSEPLDRMLAVLTRPRTADLRRNHPFAGVLSDSKRRRILRKVRDEANGP